MGVGDFKRQFTKAGCSKANHLSKMLSLSKIPNKAWKEAAPIQNRPVFIQQNADFTSLLVWFLPQKETSVRCDIATVFSVGGDGDGLSRALMLSV